MDSALLLTACAASQELIYIALATEELLDDARSATSPYLQKTNEKGRFATDFDMVQNKKKTFKENFHMDNCAFFDLLTKVEELLAPKRNTHPNDAISPKQKLAIILEYVVCGTLQRHISKHPPSYC